MKILTAKRRSAIRKWQAAGARKRKSMSVKAFANSLKPRSGKWDSFSKRIESAQGKIQHLRLKHLSTSDPGKQKRLLSATKKLETFVFKQQGKLHRQNIANLRKRKK